MYCSKCGREISENAAFCSNCGQAVNVNEKQKEPYVEPLHYQYSSEPKRKEADGYAIASLVLGILGFFCLPIIGGILAIVFGNMSLRENGQSTMARVGKILGIIGLSIMIICVVVIVACFVFVGVGTMSDLYYYM